ncbi:c-type cytochrome [Alienimonas chondri]|uniref:Cytochrome c domain-containing protein n=1 Tax=Alienimonas chondri TaxID=2681879 RepID=A0ABX1VE66_9PLAN|nr:c-type cytochrome [Alienimonas chondri]NNJ25336.1 hypothetical protein [Alienimonas chondri]
MSESLKRFLKPLGITAAGLALLGGLLVVSGIVPVRASSGHWAITRWFLSFSMARSVSTDSLDVTVPDTLDDPREILRGAGHYQTGCYPCHGNPTTPHPRVAQAMLPQPPYLPETLDQWEPEELFVIVKHGIKLAGMPAWPAEDRDDEVWAMVAFLKRYPSLSEEEYGTLVWGDAAPGQGRAALEAAGVVRAHVQTCVRCHGADGNSRGVGAFPRLAGQHEVYLAEALRAYVSGGRTSGIMEPIAAELTAEEIDALAAYFTAQTPRGLLTDPEALSPEAVARGERIARDGAPRRKVPSCVDCHGPGEAIENEAYPLLAGQPEEYLRTQLELFARGARDGSPRANLMHEVAENLSEEQMADVAAYYAAESPDGSPDTSSDE